MTATTELIKTTKCGGGTTLNTYAGTGEVKSIRIVESHYHKTPSCYMGKVFTITHVAHVESVDSDGKVSSWERWEGQFKNGKKVKFTHFADHGWNAQKDGAFASNWIKVEDAE